MKEGYERDFLRYLQSLLAEVERRIRRGHARLALSQAQQNAAVCTCNFGTFIIVLKVTQPVLSTHFCHLRVL